MIFIWGKKLVYRQLGYVGDFCPICRAPRAGMVRRVGLAGHVYYITAGEGDLVGHERTCTECRIAVKVDPATYSAFSKELRPVEELLRLTYPDFARARKDRLELEEKVRTGAGFLSREERIGLIQQPFVLLSPKVEDYLSAMRFDGRAVLVFLGLLFAVPLLMAVAAKFFAEGTDASIGANLAILGSAAALMIWQVAGAGRRYVRGEIMPVLARTLRPLKPTEAEIAGVIAELKRYKHKLGRKLDAAELVQAISQAASPRSVGR